MTAFDLSLKTMIFVASISAFSMALFFGLVTTRDRSRHMFFWTTAFSCKAMAFFLVYQGGHFPKWVSSVFATMLVLVSLHLFQVGIQALHNRSVHWNTFYIFDLIALIMLISSRVLFAPKIFLIVLSLLIAFGNSFVIFVLLRKIPAGMKQVQMLAASIFGIGILLLSIRVVWMASSSDAIFTSSSFTKALFAKEILGNMLLGMALLAMVYWRIHLDQITLIEELEYALSQVQTLQGLLPVCAWCKKIRDDKGNWQQMEEYVSLRTHAEFSHGICPECRSKLKSGKPSEGE